MFTGLTFPNAPGLWTSGRMEKANEDKVIGEHAGKSWNANPLLIPHGFLNPQNPPKPLPILVLTRFRWVRVRIFLSRGYLCHSLGLFRSLTK